MSTAVVDIVPIRVGFITSYLLRGDSLVAVDAGPPGKAEQFARGLAAAGIRPNDVRLVVLTHGHWDHVGCARDVKELTGAKLAIHEADRQCLERSLVLLPPGTTRLGRLFVAILRRLAPRITFPAAPTDVILGDQFSLRAYGIPGQIVHTPGHTPGSVTVLLDSGDALVGDLAMNGLPMRVGPGLPALAEDQAAVVESWRRLLAAGVRRVYPAHGKPFPADVMRAVVGAPRSAAG